MNKDNFENTEISQDTPNTEATEKENTPLVSQDESTNKKRKKKRQKHYESLESVTLDIPDEDIWTYQVEGLSAPAVNKPVKNRRVKQFIFIVVILIAIALSCYFSIRAVQRDTFEYKENDAGYTFSGFSNNGFIKELDIDYALEIVYDENNSDVESNFTLAEDESKPITAIEEFTFNCDNVLQVVNIGPNVEKIEGDSFYTCYELQAINVDENNPNYSSVDGVLYNKDKTELICYPMKHSEYLRQKNGYIEAVEPDAEGYEEYKEKVLTYVLEPTVTTIGELSFNYTDLVDVYMPEGVKTIETMSFFKATSLANIYTYTDYGNIDGSKYLSLPDTVEYIGSDAFSYDQALTYVYIPKGVTYMGHHAFWDCAYKDGGEIKGLFELNVAENEDAFKDKCHFGDQWCPEYDYMLFKKKVPVNYEATRQSIVNE